ncbi:MAG: prepilin peptidase [Methylophaga sp.]
MVWLLLGLWLMVCAFVDLRWRKLPNWLTFGAYLLAVLVFILMKQNLLGSSINSSLWAWILALILTMPAYAFRWLGAGDVKMLSALGLMTGLHFMLMSFVIAGLIAGFLVIYSTLSRRFVPYMNLHLTKHGWQLPAKTIFNGKSLPFGSLMAFGGLLMLVFHATGIMEMAVV